MVGEGGWCWEVLSLVLSLLGFMFLRFIFKFKLLGRFWVGEGFLGVLKLYFVCIESFRFCRVLGG